MSYLNAVLRGLFDALLYPMRSWPPLLSLALLSLVVGIAMLLVFKVTSNQGRIAEVKRKIHAGIFEIRLFNDDLRAIVRAQFEILRHNLTYLRLSLVPLLWMIVPFVLVIAQLQFHYGYGGLEPGEKALLKVELADDWNRGSSPGGGGRVARPAIDLEAPEGLRVETAGLWIPSRNEVTWRISADRPGDYELKARLAGRSVTKTVSVSHDVLRRSPSRLRPSFANQLLFPAEAPLPADVPVLAISVTYPDRGVSVLGWEVHWMIVFFVLTIVFAFALRNRLGVTI